MGIELVKLKCYKNRKFRVIVITSDGEKTGWEAPSYFSLSLLLRMLVLYYGVERLRVECPKHDPKLDAIIASLGVETE